MKFEMFMSKVFPFLLATRKEISVIKKKRVMNIISSFVLFMLFCCFLSLTSLCYGGSDSDSEGAAAAAPARKRQRAPGPPAKTELNVYLLKKHDVLPPPQEIPGDYQGHFRGFPWQFLNENKHSLIGVAHDKKSFIDGQFYDVGDGVYIFQETGVRGIKWAKKIQEQGIKHREHEKTKFLFREPPDQQKEPKGTVVFVKKKIGDDERFFAITFGMTGRYLLNLDHCDPAFGKHYAYNVLSSNQAYKARAYTEVHVNERIQRSERAKLHGTVSVLRGVRAFIPKALTVIDGKKELCSFLGAHIHIRDDFDYGTIGDKCLGYLGIASKEDYKEKYKYIDNFTPLENQDEIDAVFAGLQDYDIDIPFGAEETLDNQPSKFELKLVPRRAWGKQCEPLEQNYSDFSDLAEDLREFIWPNITKEVLKKLKKIRIFGKNDSGYLVGDWRADKLITATTERANKTYWIEGGEVYEVDRNFIVTINKTLDDHFVKLADSGPSLSKLSPFIDTDKEQKFGKQVLSEKTYNQRMQSSLPKDFLLFDCGTAMVREDPHPRSTVEPCDLMSKDGDLVHVKRWAKHSTSMSHLAVQGESSADLLVKSEKFQEAFFKKYPLKDETFKNAYDSLKGKKFRVVFAIIHRADDFTPSKHLPFNAKLALYNGILNIGELNRNSIIINIKDKSIETKKAPKRQPSSGGLPLQTAATLDEDGSGSEEDEDQSDEDEADSESYAGADGSAAGAASSAGAGTMVRDYDGGGGGGGGTSSAYRSTGAAALPDDDLDDI